MEEKEVAKSVLSPYLPNPHFSFTPFSFSPDNCSPDLPLLPYHLPLLFSPTPLTNPSQVARKAKRVDIFKRAEKFAKEYQDKERDEIRWVGKNYNLSTPLRLKFSSKYLVPKS